MSLLLSDLGSAVSQHFPEKDQNEIFARDSHAPETLERRFTRLFVVTYTHSSRGGLCGRARRLRHRTYAAASVRRAETRACSRAATRFGRLTRGVEEKERKEKKPGDDTSQRMRAASPSPHRAAARVASLSRQLRATDETLNEEEGRFGIARHSTAAAAGAFLGQLLPLRPRPPSPAHT